MEKRKWTWNLLVILAYVVLGGIWLVYGGTMQKPLEMVFGLCFLGLSLWRTYRLLRDLKNVPENSLDGRDWTNLP